MKDVKESFVSFGNAFPSKEKVLGGENEKNEKTI
jgi:hypothetical protein